MAFTMNVSSLRPAPARVSFQTPGRSLRSRSPVVKVVSHTIWQLRPDPKWCKSHEDICKTLGETIDLTETIGKKKICTLGTTEDHASDCDQVIKAVGGGVHVEFQARGESNPLDSPSQLYVTDLDSKVEIKVGNTPLKKGEETQLKPGNTLFFGDTAAFQVERNVFAHA